MFILSLEHVTAFWVRGYLELVHQNDEFNYDLDFREAKHHILV